MARGPARAIIDTLAYTAGLFGGLVGLVTGGSRRSRWRQSRVRKQTYALGERAGRGGFGRLRASLFGHSKEEVADTLGPPPAAAIGPAAAAAATTGVALPASGAPTSYWNANTWYYPFDPDRQAAIAVQFDRNRVVRVELIGGR